MAEPLTDKRIQTCEASVCGQCYPYVDDLVAEVRRLRAERDAYKRAKEENDERFMIERDAARAEVERLRDELSDEVRACDLLRVDVDQLRTAARRYRAALEEIVNYGCRHDSGGCDNECAKVAKRALAAEETKDGV